MTSLNSHSHKWAFYREEKSSDSFGNNFIIAKYACFWMTEKLYLTTVEEKFLMLYTQREFCSWASLLEIKSILRSNDCLNYKNINNSDYNSHFWASSVCQIIHIFISNPLIFGDKFEFIVALLVYSSVRFVSEPQFSSLLSGNKNSNFIEHH